MLYCSIIGCLRALFLGDNDLTMFPPNIEKFVHLEVVSKDVSIYLGTVLRGPLGICAN